MRPPMGATDTGHARGTPRRLVRRSIWRTSTRTCCWIARRSRWRRLRRSVVSVSAPPSPKFHTSRGRRSRAARRISGSVTKRGGWLMPPYYTLPREGTDADVSGPGTSGGAFRRRRARPLASAALVVVAEPEPRRGNAEPGIVRRDPEVAGDGDADAAAHAVAVDHRQEGLRQCREGVLPARGDLPVLRLVGHVAAAVLEL